MTRSPVPPDAPELDEIDRMLSELAHKVAGPGASLEKFEEALLLVQAAVKARVLQRGEASEAALRASRPERPKSRRR